VFTGPNVEEVADPLATLLVLVNKTALVQELVP
jgi:hypothetical protein